MGEEHNKAGKRNNPGGQSDGKPIGTLLPHNQPGPEKYHPANHPASSAASGAAMVEVDVIRLREKLVGIHDILNGGQKHTALERLENLIEELNAFAH